MRKRIRVPQVKNIQGNDYNLVEISTCKKHLKRRGEEDLKPDNWYRVILLGRDYSFGNVQGIRIYALYSRNREEHYREYFGENWRDLVGPQGLKGVQHES